MHVGELQHEREDDQEHAEEGQQEQDPFEYEIEYLGGAL
jgi:hypothetical protein